MADSNSYRLEIFEKINFAYAECVQPLLEFPSQCEYPQPAYEVLDLDIHELWEQLNECNFCGQCWGRGAHTLG